METLRFKNYRCFEDTGDVEIRPITVLIGANSSGKSSFLKFFPLIKQSMGEMVNGVFLWAGPLVDMKDFANTVRTGNDDLTIEYSIDKLPLQRSIAMRRASESNVRLEMHVTKRDAFFDYLQRLSIMTDYFTAEILYYPDNTARVVLNDLDSKEMEEEIHWDVNNALIPKLYYNRQGKRTSIEENSIKAREELIKELKEFGVEEEKWHQFLSPYRQDVFNGISATTILQRIDKEGKRESHYKRIVDLLQYYHLNQVIDSINLYFIYLSRKMTYVMPLRAIAERYYRFQNYSVKEIDADGKNLPMFYSSLSDEAFTDLNRWFYNIFGFTLELRASEGHLEMLIMEAGSDKARNLTDLGFGYTQVLPILTILWKVIVVDCINGADETFDHCKTHIVAIEQPELHLHPRYQGLFADMMAKVIEHCKAERKDIRIIIETHSEIIINRIGKLIAAENCDVNENDVNVVIFNGFKERLNSYVVQTKYDKAGYIEDWPYGFFSDYVDRNQEGYSRRSPEEEQSKAE